MLLPVVVVQYSDTGQIEPAVECSTQNGFVF
jgi:hypothetical protein